jgi:hypothetical protein
MTIANPPYVLQNRTDHPARSFRRALGGIVTAGVSGQTEMKVSANGTPNMTVIVASGDAYVTCYNASGGVYHVFNDGTTTATITAAHATLPRRDLVVVRVQDQEQSGSTNTADILVIAGTPNAVPVDPTLPAGASYLTIARVAVAASTTAITNSNITDLRSLASTVGGVIVCTSGTRPASAYAGQHAFESDTSRVVVWDGSAWQTTSQLGSWTAYTPVWTSSGTAPVLGNGTLTGSYIQIGKTVHYRIRLRTGTTTTYGTGSYRFSLPVTTVATFAGAGEVIGQASLLDASPSARYARNAYTYDDTKVSLVDEAGTGVTNTVPFTWANTDTLSIVGTYEAA